jgi:hypothetical protein
MAAGFNTAIDSLGVPMLWTQAAEGGQSASIVAGFRAVGKDDEVIINSYGIETKVITVKVDSLPVPPQKFDRFVVQGETYVAQSSHQIYLNGVLIGHKCYCKGR